MAKKNDCYSEEQIKKMFEKGIKRLEKLDCKDKKKNVSCGSTTGCVWFLAFIGAAVYYIQQATSFGMGVIGFLKALVWPAFLIYHLLEFLKI